jgi:hypothetical protein
MYIDWSPFPVNKLDLENPVVLIRSKQADTTKGNNVVIGDPRPLKDVESTPSHKVVVEKLPMVKWQSQLPSRALRQVVTHEKPKDHLSLATTESGSQPPLTRSRRSDRYPIGQTAMADQSRRQSIVVRPLLEPVRPPHTRTDLRGWSSHET